VWHWSGCRFHITVTCWTWIQSWARKPIPVHQETTELTLHSPRLTQVIRRACMKTTQVNDQCIWWSPSSRTVVPSLNRVRGKTPSILRVRHHGFEWSGNKYGIHTIVLQTVPSNLQSLAISMSLNWAGSICDRLWVQAVSQGVCLPTLAVSSRCWLLASAQLFSLLCDTSYLITFDFNGTWTSIAIQGWYNREEGLSWIKKLEMHRLRTAHCTNGLKPRLWGKETFLFISESMANDIFCYFQQI